MCLRFPGRAAIAAIACGVALGGCATPTPYAPAERAGGYGYSEQRLEDDRFLVRFRGNSASGAQAADFALLRAAELTLQYGYDWFEVVRRGEERDGSRGYGGGSGVSIGVGGAGGSRGSSVGVGVGMSFPLGGSADSTPSEAFVEIIARKAPIPDSPDAYDARELSARLLATAR
ncbi:MAG: hypothetical protein MI723_08810 [Caulobacterales bacterium]|nr:hypothetical protein [Caulobacterales bacterium]